MLNLNAKGPYFIAQKLVPLMPEGSSVVFTTSIACAARKRSGFRRKAIKIPLESDQVSARKRSEFLSMQ